MTGHILVVEDEPSIADNITYALETEGFTTTWCATGSEGMAVLGAGRIDLLILDVGLPDQNGFELAREILRTSGVPIIFVTARSSEIDRVVGLEIGADDYVVKPFSPRELTARVKAVLRRAGQQAVTPTPAAAPPTLFAIDDQRFRISYLGQPLELSRYEFRLLALLVRHPGRVFSRDQLMDRVWEEPEMSLERTVDTHIKNIRQKLRAVTPERELILTHRGLGYSLREHE